MVHGILLELIVRREGAGLSVHVFLEFTRNDLLQPIDLQIVDLSGLSSTFQVPDGTVPTCNELHGVGVFASPLRVEYPSYQASHSLTRGTQVILGDLNPCVDTSGLGFLRQSFHHCKRRPIQIQAQHTVQLLVEPLGVQSQTLLLIMIRQLFLGDVRSLLANLHQEG